MDDMAYEPIQLAQKADARFTDVLLREEQRMHDALHAKKIELDKLIRLDSARAQGPRNAASIFGIGYAGYGNGWTEGKPRILYPKERKRVRRHLRDLNFSRELQRSAAKQEETLVPIRLDIDFDKYKIRDTLTWNLYDSTVPLDLFAEQLCEDYGLPLSGFAKDIERAVRAQVTEYHPHKFSDARTSEDDRNNDGIYTDSRDDDLRISIKLDITVGSCNLLDQFEWDINNANNDAERYAESFCAEFGLSAEFRTAIAHAIREQCQMYTKSLFLAGYSFDGKGVHDADLRQMIMPPIFSCMRPKHQMDQFAPILSELDMEQLERIERDREREGRRNRRQTRGKRGAILPDLHDLPKTYRTSYVNTVLIPAEQRNGTQDYINHTSNDNDFANESDEDDEFMLDEEDTPRNDRSTRNSRAARQNLSYSEVKPLATRSTQGQGSASYDASRPPPFSSGINPRMTARRSPSLDTRDQALRKNYMRDAEPVVLNRGTHYSPSIDNNNRHYPASERINNLESPEPSCLVVLKIPRAKLRSLIHRTSEPPRYAWPS